MKKNILTIILVCTYLMGLADKDTRSSISIQGVVRQRVDKFNRYNQLKKRYVISKLANVNIALSIDDIEIFDIMSNSEGEFEIKFNLDPKHNYRLTFSKEGYYPKVIDFETNNIQNGKELKIKNWDFYLFPEIEGQNPDIFFKPFRESYDDEFGSMTYDYVYNENLEREQERIYRIYREYQVNAKTPSLLSDSTIVHPDDIEKVTENPVKSKLPDIKKDLYHSKSIEKEDSMINEMRIHIHTQKAQLELDKLKAQTHEDKKEIEKREQEILLAETEILLAEQEIENSRRRLALQDAENKNQRVLLIASSISLFILSIFLVVLVRNSKNRKRINTILKSRNTDIIAKNNEILDSIKYAKRLQRAILPPEETVNTLLPKAFILYLPKDIVSGDFYWVEKSEEKIYFAAVDCTGHGVPGAFMSIVGYNGLNQALKENSGASPSAILNYLNESVSRTLRSQHHDGSYVRDGMDIALCSFNPQTRVLEYAGAYNHLYVIRNHELIIYRADKRPVGAYIDQKVSSFSNHTIQLETNDLVYIFTDGYADQFGGEKNKKLKFRNLKQILFDIFDKPMEEQKRLLNEAFLNWKGAEEQVDDVLIIGIKIE